MSQENFEERIREKRVFQAMQNNLLGPDSKLRTILKHLGEPIAACYFSDDLNYEDGNIPEVYIENLTGCSIDDMENLPTMSHDILGHLYDALKNGINLQIVFMEEDMSIVVRHDGYVVYEEIANELTIYKPNPVWESFINRLYERAKNMEKAVRIQEKKERIEKASKNKASFLQRIRERWGI